MAEDSDIDDDFVQMVIGWYNECRDHTSTWRNEARESYDFVAGNQWDSEDVAILQDQSRPAVVFNRVQRTLNAVTGTQIQNRQETRFFPRELGDTGVNEVLSAAAEWVRDECDADDEESDSFQDLCICGMGWTETRPSYDEEPDGKILIERTDPLEMFWDTSAKKKNLSDSKWRMRVRMWSRVDFEEMWPDADLDGAAMPWSELDDEGGSVSTHVYPQDAYKESRAFGGSSRGGDIRVAQVQWYEYADSYRVGPHAVEMTADAFDKLKDKIEEQQLPWIKQRGKVFRQAFVAGNQVLEETESPFPHGFSLNVMTGVRDRNRNVWVGLVSIMKDPQRWANKVMSLILDIIGKGSKGGLMAESDAVDDWRELEDKWSSPDGIIRLKPGALSQGKVQPKPAVEHPASLDRILDFATTSVHDTTGVNVEMLGYADRVQPGVLEWQRKQAGMTMLSTWFDALRKYRKEQGRTLLYMIRTYLPEGTLIRITGDTGQEYIPLVKSSEVAKFDVIVDEAPSSPNQKERTFATLQEIMPSLTTMGLMPPPSILEYMPLPNKVVQDWKKQIEETPKVDPQMQMQMQELEYQIGQLSEENAKLKDKKAETEAKIALAREEAEADVILKKQDLEFKRQEAEITITAKRADAEADNELAKAKAEADFALRKWIAENDLELEQFKAGAKAKLEEDKAEYQRQGQMDGIARTISEVPIKLPKRRLRINRNDDGFMDTVDIEDDFDTMGEA